jgi:MFS family permease
MSDTTPNIHPLSIADFRYYWLARFMAVLATMGMVVVIGYQAYDIARSDYGMSIREASLQLGLLGLVQFVPLALLTPVAGWAADRWERRTVARLANSIDMIVALALGWFTYIDGLTLPLLFVFAALHGVARVFVGPSMSAIAPNIVPPASLPRAIALSSIAWQVGSVFGPAAGGLMFAESASLPYWVSAGLMLAATISLSCVKPVRPPRMEKKIHPIRQMIDGLRYTWSERFLLGAITHAARLCARYPDGRAGWSWPVACRASGWGVRRCAHARDQAITPQCRRQNALGGGGFWRGNDWIWLKP